MSFHVEMASYESFSAVASALASSTRSKASQVKTGRLIASRPREFIEAIYFGNDFACKRFPQRWILPVKIAAHSVVFGLEVVNTDRDGFVLVAVRLRPSKVS